MKYFLKTTTVLISIILLSSCKDEYTFCNTPTAVNFNTIFFKPSSGVTGETPTLAPNLNIKLISTGAAIYTNQPNIGGYVLNLNPATDSAKYQISVADNLPKDTLTVIYTSTKINLSPECGDVFYKNIVKYKSTLHTIDSVRVTNASVTNIEVENARIFF